MADYACSLVPCRLFFTRTLRRCLALQICVILSHSRYTVTYFISNHPSMRHPPHLLISITCLHCPHIIFPSHTGCRLNRSICTSMDFVPPSSRQKLDFRVPSGNSSILGTSGIACYLCTWICSNLGDKSVPLLKPQSIHVHSDFFFPPQHDNDKIAYTTCPNV